MLKYFPFDGVFSLRMGTSLLKENEFIVETDDRYVAEIRLKRKLLSQDHGYYFQSRLNDTDSIEWDVVEKIIDDLVMTSSDFSVAKTGARWSFYNRLLDERQDFEFRNSVSLPFAPLDWIGRQVQEDLVILNANGEIVAGQLCFPSGWSLGEKIGKQFLEVHQPLPDMTLPMIQAANKLVARIPVDKPVTRNSWGFRLGNDLDLSSKHAEEYKLKIEVEAPALTKASIGNKIFLRVEHQALMRLSRSGCILFTIHTYHNELAHEAANPERKKRMLEFLETTPAGLIDYKQMASFYDLLLGYLRS